MHLSLVLTLLILSFQTKGIFGGTPYEDQDYPYQLAQYINSINKTQYLWPIKDYRKIVIVQCDIYINQLLGVSGSDQSAKVSAFMRFYWSDERIVWDKTLFGGVDVYDMGANDLWYPKILLYNGVGDVQYITPSHPLNLQAPTPALTTVSFSVKRDLEISCSLDLSKFPNDEHTCDIQLYIFDESRPTQLLAIAPTSGNRNLTALYSESNEWILTNITQGPVTEKRKHFTNVPAQDVNLFTISMKLKRIKDYYLYTMVIPMGLLTLLQVLVFFVPIESGEKLSLGITILLSFTVFLLIMDSIIPKTKEMPLMTFYITGSICLSAITMILSGMIMRMYYKSEKEKMSSCSRAFLIKFLARAMCVRIPRSLSESGKLNSSKVDIIAGDKESQNDKEYRPPSDAASDDDEDVNLWQIGAMALEKLLFYVGLLAVIGLTCGFFIPPFLD